MVISFNVNKDNVTLPDTMLFYLSRAIPKSYKSKSRSTCPKEYWCCGLIEVTSADLATPCWLDVDDDSHMCNLSVFYAIFNIEVEVMEELKTRPRFEIHRIKGTCK